MAGMFIAAEETSLGVLVGVTIRYEFYTLFSIAIAHYCSMSRQYVAVYDQRMTQSMRKEVHTLSALSVKHYCTLSL